MDPAMTEDGRAPAGAVSELAHDEASRKRFLKMVGGAGAAGAFAIFLAACGDDEDEKAGGNGAKTPAQGGGRSAKVDLEIVNYALTLEYLEADFYEQVVASGELKGAVQEAAKVFGDHEQEHVDALTATVRKLGGRPAAKPTTKFDDVLAGGQKKILETAASVENLGAAAYLGQAGRIKSPEVLAAALSIHSVEARHAAALNTLIGEDPVQDGTAFAKPAAMAEVLEMVKPFIAA